MGKGGYLGGGTLISPTQNPDWFSNQEDGETTPTGQIKRSIEMSAETDVEIANLRRSIIALSNRLQQAKNDLESEKAKLRRILIMHRQPLDDGL